MKFCELCKSTKWCGRPCKNAPIEKQAVIVPRSTPNATVSPFREQKVIHGVPCPTCGHTVGDISHKDFMRNAMRKKRAKDAAIKLLREAVNEVKP